jgi:hypothetical protein
MIVMLGITACASEQTPPAPAPVLDGPYHDPTDGAFAWLAFHDGTYGATSGEADCRVAQPPASCDHSGTYVIDVAAGELTLTEDGTGAVTQLRIRVDASVPRSTLTSESSVRPQAVGTNLIAGTNVLQASERVITEMGVSVERGPAELVDYRGMARIIYMACALLNTGEVTTNRPVDQIEPITPPTLSVVRSSGCNKSANL